MPGRTFAIGDIHGCSRALTALLNLLDLQPTDTLVTLGDYVDRGLDSRGVLENLIALESRCRLVPILGNHDEMMLQAQASKAQLKFWLNSGGISALQSYGDALDLKRVPAAHFRFLERCLPLFETETHFFVHGNYEAHVPLAQLDRRTLRWLSLRDSVPGPHDSGKIAVVGHTPHREVLDLGYLIDIDTGCCREGWLTALEIESGQIWQVDQRGLPRTYEYDDNHEISR